MVEQFMSATGLLLTSGLIALFLVVVWRLQWYVLERYYG